jgi:hypothetical protein
MNRALRKALPGLAIPLLIISACNRPVAQPPTPTALLLVPATATMVPPTPTVELPEVTASPAVVPASAALYGLVWEDQDRDGLQDFQEMGVPNVAVSLLTSAKTVTGTTTTDSNGAYQFKDLVPGDYLVNLQLPPGYVFSPQDQGVNELVDSDNDPATAETLPVTLASGGNGLVFTTGMYSPTAAVLPASGTVQPPPADLQVCAPGNYSLGGLATLAVNQLAAGYCLHAFLWNHAFAIGRIPDDAGDLLSAVTFVEFFYQGIFVYKYDVPGETNSIQVCYAVPGGSQAQIYFFDHYGPRFGQRPPGQPSWTALETTLSNGIACAVAQTSGAYALIGE